MEKELFGLFLQLCLGIGYAIAMRTYLCRQRGHTGLYVVIGVTGVLALNALATSVDIYLLWCFALAGLPMLLEYYTRGKELRK